MPKAKPKRKKNFLGFGRGGLFSTSTTYHVGSRSGSKRGKSRASASSGDTLWDDITKGMGGKSYKSLSPSGQATVRKLADKVRNPKRKRNASALALGLPKNKWINAKIRVTSSGKAQAMVSEGLLGHAKAGGSVSLNPRRRRRKK
jgi:hypothetical protein